MLLSSRKTIRKFGVLPINLFILILLIMGFTWVEFITYNPKWFWDVFLYVSFPANVSLTVLVLLVLNILIKCHEDFEAVDREQGDGKVETRLFKLEYQRALACLFSGLGVASYGSFVPYEIRLPMAKSYMGFGFLLSTPFLFANVVLIFYYVCCASKLKDYILDADAPRNGVFYYKKDERF